MDQDLAQATHEAAEFELPTEEQARAWADSPERRALDRSRWERRGLTGALQPVTAEDREALRSAVRAVFRRG